MVARLSAKAEYRAMAPITCELMWIKNLLQELWLPIRKSITVTIKLPHILLIIPCFIWEPKILGWLSLHQRSYGEQVEEIRRSSWRYVEKNLGLFNQYKENVLSVIYLLCF